MQTGLLYIERSYLKTNFFLCFGWCLLRSSKAIVKVNSTGLSVTAQSGQSLHQSSGTLHQGPWWEGAHLSDAPERVDVCCMSRKHLFVRWCSQSLPSFWFSVKNKQNNKKMLWIFSCVTSAKIKWPLLVAMYWFTWWF